MPSLSHNLDGSPHTHCYVRARRDDLRKDRNRFICNDPFCTHTAQRAQLYGKASLCAVCKQNTFILTPRSLKLARPRCEQCSKTREALAKRQTKDTLEQLLEQQGEGSK